VHVLLVEDNPADALLAAELIKETGIPAKITTVSDGDFDHREVDSW
jgi:CheY-like chemotaxis protein